MKGEILCASLMILLGLIHFTLLIINVKKHKKQTSQMALAMVCTSSSLLVLFVISIILFDVLFVSSACVCIFIMIVVSNMIDYVDLKQKEKNNNDHSKETK